MTYRACGQCGRPLAPGESSIEVTEEVTVGTEDGDVIESRTISLCRSCVNVDVD